MNESIKPNKVDAESEVEAKIDPAIEQEGGVPDQPTLETVGETDRETMYGRLKDVVGKKASEIMEKNMGSEERAAALHMLGEAQKVVEKLVKTLYDVGTSKEYTCFMMGIGLMDSSIALMLVSAACYGVGRRDRAAKEQETEAGADEK